MSQFHKLGKIATSIRTEKSKTIVRYHSTDVVEFDSCFVSLNSGGWKTATTKARMNQASNQFGLNYQVYQKDLQWYACLPDGQIVAFRDGITFPRYRS